MSKSGKKKKPFRIQLGKQKKQDPRAMWEASKAKQEDNMNMDEERTCSPEKASYEEPRAEITRKPFDDEAEEKKQQDMDPESAKSQSLHEDYKHSEQLSGGDAVEIQQMFFPDDKSRFGHYPGDRYSSARYIDPQDLRQQERMLEARRREYLEECERYQKESRQKAHLILEQATLDASNVRSQASQDAENIRAQANRTAAELREQAQHEINVMREQAQREIAKMRAEALQEVEAYKTQRLVQIEPEIAAEAKQLVSSRLSDYFSDNTAQEEAYRRSLNIAFTDNAEAQAQLVSDMDGRVQNIQTTLVQTMSESVQQLQSIQDRMVMELDSWRRQLYKAQYQDFAVCFNNLDKMVESTEKRLAKEVAAGDVGYHPELAEELKRYVKNLKILRGVFERSLSNLGIRAFYPETGTPFNSLFHTAYGMDPMTETDDDFNDLPVMICVKPGLLKVSENGDIPLLKAVVTVNKTGQ